MIVASSVAYMIATGDTDNHFPQSSKRVSLQ